jgi:hypothetical protein
VMASGGRTFTPLAAFHQLEILYSASLPTSTNRLSRQAHCSGRLTFQIHTIMCVHPPSNWVPRNSRFSEDSTIRPIYKPKSAIEKRSKVPACFLNGYSSSLLFICLHCKPYPPRYFIHKRIRLRQGAHSPYESGDPIMHTTFESPIREPSTVDRGILD